MGNFQSHQSTPIQEINLKPKGIYNADHTFYDLNLVQKFIKEHKLAPFRLELFGDCANTSHECPICFINYEDHINSTTCCKKQICTECLVSLRPPLDSKPLCPFCNSDSFFNGANDATGNTTPISFAMIKRPTAVLRPRARSSQFVTRRRESGVHNAVRRNTIQEGTIPDIQVQVFNQIASEIEEMMIMEAIRLSLLEQQQQHSDPNDDN
ncbi:hypothetical protein ROZALSC1DRAFT_26876 [Rozella allomycis CSF55]|uniref:RING-type domain-containing protein n=1 Tax=Rozella allomycis (strain CSF55) TaxID=988480 RepID=A0A4P9YQ10_ROZAC|nr:hypothetical protein ROZALSC1DRAFT_26876 [Rozella allomycis CSF55]